MIVLVPNSQDSWSEVDWALFNFLEYCSLRVDGFEIPELYYANLEKYAQESHSIGLRLHWVDTLYDGTQEPAGWELDLEGAELLAFVLKWR